MGPFGLEGIQSIVPLVKLEMEFLVGKKKTSWTFVQHIMGDCLQCRALTGYVNIHLLDSIVKYLEWCVSKYTDHKYSYCKCGFLLTLYYGSIKNDCENIK